MSRKERLRSDIRLNLIDFELTEKNIITKSSHDTDEYDNICDVINNCDTDISIDKIETDDDIRFQIS
jgi:hypothetical protein